MSGPIKPPPPWTLISHAIAKATAGDAEHEYAQELTIARLERTVATLASRLDAVEGSPPVRPLRLADPFVAAADAQAAPVVKPNVTPADSQLAAPVNSTPVAPVEVPRRDRMLLAAAVAGAAGGLALDLILRLFS